MEPTEQNPENIAEESFLQEEIAEPVKETRLIKFTKSMLGGIMLVLIIAVVTFIVFTLKIGATH